jgi:pilus assembly protein CpaB
MNTNRLLIGLGAALVIAFLFSTFVYRQFKQATGVKPAAMQPLVVAASPLQLGARLDPSNLRVISWPANQPVAGMFTRIEDCVNRAVITNVTENEPILESKLAPKESGAGLPATIPEGMRAITVAVNDVIGVAGFVIPGTMVDVLATGQMPGQSNNKITRTILENVRVLAAGQKIEQDREGKPQTVSVITLLVTPDDATTLTMGATEGKIQLALRNTIDTKKADPAPVLEAVLFAPPGGVKPAAPAPNHSRKQLAPPPQLYMIEVITGSKRENKSFPANPDHQSNNTEPQ